MFSTVLVANRGEIAVRVIRTLRTLGIRSVAVHSASDAGARHVNDADAAVAIGAGLGPRQAYLDIDGIVTAASAVGADAIHPGYGFLAENAAFAEACAAAGIVFVGPPPDAIRAMGDKIAAKRMVAAGGVRVVPGSEADGLDDRQLAEAAMDIGFPVLIKPSAGGGGQGMRLVERPEALAEAIAAARRLAMSAFAHDALLVERFVPNPRHIEVQIAADEHGAVVHLGERECSVQRRHQKVIEEAPSTFVTPERRAAMGAQGVAAARACGYVNVGTVEMIVGNDAPDDFFFMEMNTRLQVEHPVTELVYGVDLVETQLRIAAGERLSWRQDELVPTGHAVEARVYAEDPGRGFLPTGGVVRRLREPTGDGVRVDSSLTAGLVIGSDYDPLLSKVIASGTSRAEAIARLDSALADTCVLGVTTNIGFLRRLLADADVRAGRLDTGLIDRRHEELVGEGGPSAAAKVAAAVAILGPTMAVDPWRRATSWRLGGPQPLTVELASPGVAAETVVARWDGDAWIVTVDGTDHRARFVAGDGSMSAVDVHDDRGTTRCDVDRVDHSTVWVGEGGRAWELTRPVHRRRASGAVDDEHGDVLAPMPGAVTAVHVAVGDAVHAGQVLAIVEAMKMEHAMRALAAGVVTAVSVREGQQVRLGDRLLTLGPSDNEGGP